MIPQLSEIEKRVFLTLTIGWRTTRYVSSAARVDMKTTRRTLRRLVSLSLVEQSATGPRDGVLLWRVHDVEVAS